MPKSDSLNQSSLDRVASGGSRSTDSNSEVCTPDEASTLVAWLQVVCAALLNSSASLAWLSCACAPLPTTEWMQISLSQLNLITTMTPIFNTIFSLGTGWSYERFGIKKNLLFAGTFISGGCWVRCISILLPIHQRYALVMFGQVIASMGAPFVYNISAKLAAVWFPPKHRGIANSLTASSLGAAIAPLLIPVLAPSPDSVPKMLLVIAGIATVSALPLPFLPSKPRKPPSASATTQRLEVKKSIRQLASRLDFWCIAIACMANTGMGYTISTIIIQAIVPYGYSELQAGICSSVIILSGYAGGAITGYWLGKTAQYLMLIKMLTPMVLFTYIMFIFQIVPNALGAIIVACILNGFFSYALLPVYVEFACELFYPIPEAVSSSLLWSLITVGTIVLTVVADSLRAGSDADPPNNMRNSMIALAIAFFVMSLPCIRLKGDLKRLAIDNEKGSG